MKLFVWDQRLIRLKLKIIMKIKKIKGVSKSQRKHNKLEECKRCLYGKELQEK